MINDFIIQYVPTNAGNTAGRSWYIAILNDTGYVVV